MKIIISLAFIVAIHGAAVINDSEHCDGIKINDVHYVKEVLKTNLDRPYSLAVDYGTNILYFSYSLKPTDDAFETAKINLYTKEFAVVKGVDNGFVQTVDQENHVPYIGSNIGIYKYDYSSNEANAFGAEDYDIWEIYFRNGVIYFSDFPKQFLYTLKDGVVTRSKDLDDTKVIHFVIDDDNVMFYTNATGLYSKPEGVDDSYLYKELHNGDTVRGITIDNKGHVYACLDDGVYLINTATGTLDKVVDIYDAFGVAFDANDNMIYSDATSVVHLKPNKNC